MHVSRKIQPLEKTTKPAGKLLTTIFTHACPCLNTSNMNSPYTSMPSSSATQLVYVAPEKIENICGHSVFLAGSIEQGKAVPWQAEIIRRLERIECTVFNPRRKDWDPTWEQRKSNPKFKEQVEWELDCQERADVIAMNFDPATTSPITLLELGLFAEATVGGSKAKTKKLVVCCPDGYYRKGNVEIVCDRYGIEMVENFDVLVEKVQERLGKSKEG